MEHQKLYQLDRKGNIKEWTVSVLVIDGVPNVRKVFGRIGGKLQVNDKSVPKGKNIGKANETTPYEQACLVAESDWKKQIDKGYTTDPSGESDVVRPMLALTFPKNAHRMPQNCFVQPKLNGVRCLIHIKDGNVTFESKKGKSYDRTLQHLIPEVKSLGLDNAILDGEVYVHKTKTFKWITERVKKVYPDSNKLEFHWYDIVNDMPNKDRIDIIETAITMSPDIEMIKAVPVFEVQSHAEIKALHDQFVDDQYEGAIIRDPNGMYHSNQRVEVLQKYKEFIDHEFEIIGGRPAEGTQEGCVIFRVKGFPLDKNGNICDNEVVFDCSPRGDLETRRRWMNEIDTIIGKKLTVRYHDLSADNIPVPNPVGIAIRDYE